MRARVLFGSILIVALTVGGSAIAADRYVDPAGLCGSNTPCYTTITAALAAVAVDGETIDVGPGSYSENIVINRAVNLIGAGSGVTTLASANGASEFLILLGATVPITFSQGMVIEGFTFKGPLDGDEDLLMFRARVADPNDPIIIRNNVFDCEDDHAVKGIESRSGGDITNVVVENNQFINECRYQMFLNSAINWLIQDNEFLDTWTGGLLIDTGDVDQTHDIVIQNNTFDSEVLRPDAGGFLPNHYLSAVGLGSTVYNVEVKGNSIKNGGGHSVGIGDRGSVDLTNVVVSCNDMDNNVGGGFNQLPANVIPSEDNYWGAADGPSGVGPGSGDPVTTGLDFEPFLTAPPGPDCPTPPQVPATLPWAMILLGAAMLALLSWGAWALRHRSGVTA